MIYNYDPEIFDIFSELVQKINTLETDDISGLLEEVCRQLETVGIEKVIEEAQRQLNEFQGK